MTLRKFTKISRYLADLIADTFLKRRLHRRLIEPLFADLAACPHAQEARTLAALISRFSASIRQNELDGTQDRLVRPFIYTRSLETARSTIHGRRDWHGWRLSEMATRAPELIEEIDPSEDPIGDQARPSGYGPAGVLFVELALEQDSITVPDDVLHMLLLRADETWPNVDADMPLPVDHARIAALLLITAARLDEDQLARARRCFMSDEPYQRLFLGEAAYFALPDDNQCSTTAN